MQQLGMQASVLQLTVVHLVQLKVGEWVKITDADR
jgi:hypothetical protein